MSAAQEHGDVTASHYVDYDEYVDFQLEKARAHIRSAEVFTTLTLLVTAFIGYLLLFVVFDQWVIEGGFGPRTRLGMLSLLLVVGGYVFVRRVVVPLLRRVHPLYAARMIERAEPKFNSNLLNFVDLRDAAAPGTAPIVLRAIEKRAAVQLSHLDVDEAIDRRPLLQTAYALLAVVVVSALYIVLSPKDPFSSVKRALLPTADIDVATETTIAEVTPGDESVPARSQVIVEADIRGKEANTAQILFTTADHRDVDQPVEMRRIDEGLPRFRGTLNGENGRGLLQSLSYVIVAGDARSREYRIDVIQPPSARVDEVDYAYPDYMQLEKKTANSGNIDAWEGTATTVRATANMPIKSATLVLTDTDESGTKGEEIPMSVAEGTQLSTTWKVGFREDGTFPRFYRIEVKTAKGEVDPDPTRYSLKVRPDQRPEVTLLSPTGDLQKPANAIIPLVIQAADPDFKVRSILLKAERNGEEILSQRLFEERLPDQAIRGTHELSLKTLKARPGETLQFWVEARDNKVPTANRGTTPKVNLQILAEKSAEEVQQELANDKQAQQDQLASADKEMREARRDPAPEEPAKNPDEGDNRSEKPEERAAPGDTPSEPQDAATNSDEDPATRRDPGEAGSDRSPPANDPQQALERLLRDVEEEQAKKEPSEPSEVESGEETGERSSTPAADAKKGTEKKKGTENQRTSDPDRTQPPNKPSAKEESEQESAEDRGEEPSQPDRKKPGSEAGKKASSGDSGKKGADQQAKKPDGGKSSDKTGTDQTSSAPDRDTSPKSAAKSKPKEPKPEGGAGAEKTEGTGKQPKKNEPDDSAAEPKPSSSGKDDEGKSPPEPGKKNSPDPDKEGKPEKEGKADESADSSDAESETEKSDEEKSRSSSSDPASDGAGDKNPTGSDDDATKGTPSSSPSDKGEEKEGEGEGGESSPKPGTKSGPKKPPKASDDPDGEGEEEPAGSDPEAKKSKATGKETGEAEGADEPDPEAADASENVKRKPNSKPGAQQDSRKSSKAADKPPKSEGDQPKTGQRKSPSDVPTDARPNDEDQEASKAEPKSTRPGKEPKPDAAKSDNAKKPRDPKRDPPKPKAPTLGNREEGSKKEGAEGKQKSNSDDPAGEAKECPDGTASGSEGSSKEGKPGKEGQPGKESQPGQGKSSEAGGESKDPSGAKQPSSSGKEGEGKGSEGESGEPGKGKGSAGKNSSSSGERGKPSGQPGSQPGGTPTPQQVGGGITGPVDGGEGEGGNSGDAADGPGKGRSEGEGDGPPTPQDDEARLDYAKKATSLVLSRLKKQLERGDVDEQLLKEMGWKDRRDVEKFVKYLEENLNASADDNSAEAVAKRLQFEETLRSLRTGSETERRLGGRSIERRTQQTGARNVPLPPEYREQFEAYSKSLSKQSTTGDAPRSKAGKK